MSRHDGGHHRAQAGEEALSAAEETARQRLMEIEDLYRNAPVGLCVLDRDLRYVRINERLAEINGHPRRGTYRQTRPRSDARVGRGGRT